MFEYHEPILHVCEKVRGRERKRGGERENGRERERERERETRKGVLH